MGTANRPIINFADRLAKAIALRGNPVVVGLDPRADQLPANLRAKSSDWLEQAGAYEEFCRGVIDAVAPLVPAVKPQAAFFEQLGPAGMTALGRVTHYARDRGLLVILDGKRNDIGSTAEAYAAAYLSGGEQNPWASDALTVSPYLGDDSLEPFATAARANGTGVFVLVKTSNAGSGTLQDLKCAARPLYQIVAQHVEGLATATAGQCGYGSVGAVVGATYPEQLAELRSAMPHSWFLVPGYGSQGAKAKDVAAAFDERGLGAIINSSRAIIFAHRRKEFAERFGDARWQDAVAAATHEMIEELVTETFVKNLIQPKV